MSVRINLAKLVEAYCETEVDIEVSIDECLSMLEHSFKSNIEAGAPRILVKRILAETEHTVTRMQELYKKTWS